ncbi:transcriptional regulator, DeoR family, putative [Euzebya pacifica]|uniref:Lactose phosphotransferase system repressor n=1 Tax=Euzebya pacifica TaxID=1608957 RepID=A0A346XVW1_9ACTN|nr:DeoR/GlpR family DNA-binding transcription regulator [Euzebya pacifica]AXV06358.1 transcriptional regulator, DeoR family, putative [Euzebya pacifica]
MGARDVAQPDDDEPTPARIRRDRTVGLLREREFVRVADLAEAFKVSEVTVRGDLDHLEDRGLLKRVRGGAVPRPMAEPERTFEETATTAQLQKRAIAARAVDMVEPGDSIILDVGTTTTAIAHELATREDLVDVSVFTSSITIALALEAAHPRISVVVTGGTLRPKQHSLVEPLAGLILEHINARLAFIGCNGVDVTAGVTNVNLPESTVKRRMIRAAARRVIVADASKLGQVALAKVCDLDHVDLLITDDQAPEGVVADLRTTGLAVETVDVRGSLTAEGRAHR